MGALHISAVKTPLLLQGFQPVTYLSLVIIIPSAALLGSFLRNVYSDSSSLCFFLFLPFQILLVLTKFHPHSECTSLRILQEKAHSWISHHSLWIHPKPLHPNCGLLPFQVKRDFLCEVEAVAGESEGLLSWTEASPKAWLSGEGVGQILHSRGAYMQQGHGCQYRRAHGWLPGGSGVIWLPKIPWCGRVWKFLPKKCFFFCSLGSISWSIIHPGVFLPSSESFI